MNDKTFRLSKDQAEKIFKDNLKQIKKTIKKKIHIYDPLDFKTAYSEFIKWAQDDDFKVIKEVPGDCTFETYLDDLIKGFLIEKTYFHFLFEEEDLIIRFVKDISKKNGIPPNPGPEISVFVREKLEDKNKLAAIKKSFREGSKLKTYFYTMTRNAVMDYERKYNVKVEWQDSIDMDKFKSAAPSPHIKLEEKEIKERVEKLGHQEKVALKMYYYENITNFNAMARTLKTTRHKAKKILENAVDKVLKGRV
ncbi:MAG: sigma-70 family RNA polymerase sigma factor [Candidatus Aminicenantes bacterium]|nr:MAG: sigma-70 family RNA polymerase sigma factor [Candidatus Aminicenantes bacterium]